MRVTSLCESLVIAIGTVDGKRLTKEHFGDSNIYAIYRVYRDGKIERIEDRHNTAKDVEERQHGDPKKFRAVLEILKDVDVLVAWAMGPNYVRIRDKSDKVPYILKGEARKTMSVDDAVKEVVERFDEIYEMVKRKKSR